MASDKKILISTVYIPKKNERYDYLGSNSSNRFFKFYLPRIESAGLRFIKQNIPEVEILEYPTWDEFKRKINEKAWDVVGFSFFMNETYEILEMVKYARDKGIKEIWAGNYGAMTEEIHHYFDRVFHGYSETEIAKEFRRNIQPEEFIHPSIIAPANLAMGIKLNCMGVLYTNRGCSNHCDFCQTPPFCRKPYKIPLESIDKVLQYYKKIGITEIVILDESFGCFRKHAEKVIDLLDKYGLYWFAMTRADLLGQRLDDWSRKRMCGAFIGIESFNQTTLNSMQKKEKTDDILDVVQRMRRLHKFIVGYYMIGFEADTKESLKKDLAKLASLSLDITQLCVVTPLPRTPQWEYIESTYGIIDTDWHHYNCKHLVWNHPHIQPQEMRILLQEGFKQVYPSTRIFQTSFNFVRRYLHYEGLFGGLNYLTKHFIQSNQFDLYPKEMRFLPFHKNKESFESSNKEKNKRPGRNLNPSPELDRLG